MRKKTKRKLRTRLIHRCSSEEGFALPIALGIGIIMLLMGATMIMRSQGDQVTASAQKATNRGLSAAETGITRYQSLINRNRVIATYPRTGTPGWTTASAIPGIVNSCSGNNGAEIVANMATTNWQDVDPPNSVTSYAGDPSKGQYRLVDYVYQADSVAATIPGTGTITVEGRVNQVSSGNIASAGLGTATTRLQVNIRVAKQASSGTIPGLWVSNVPQVLGGNLVNGNILVSGCTIPAWTNSDKNNDPQKSVTTGNIVVASPNANMPDTPSLPSNNLYSLDGKSNAVWGQTFPRANDQAQPDGTYTYLITSDLNNPAASNIEIKSGTKVIFFVQGNIKISGNTNINVGGDPSQMQIYGNTNQLQPNDTTKPKYGCSAGLSCPTTVVEAGGTGSISALIHAPDATGAVSGGGGDCNANSTPPNGFIGAVWIKNWDIKYGANASNALVCAKGDYGSFLATQNNAPPAIGSITSWQRQEAQP